MPIANIAAIPNILAHWPAENAKHWNGSAYVAPSHEQGIQRIEAAIGSIHLDQTDSTKQFLWNATDGCICKPFRNTGAGAASEYIPSSSLGVAAGTNYTVFAIIRNPRVIGADNKIFLTAGPEPDQAKTSQGQFQIETFGPKVNDAFVPFGEYFLVVASFKDEASFSCRIWINGTVAAWYQGQSGARTFTKFLADFEGDMLDLAVVDRGMTIAEQADLYAWAIANRGVRNDSLIDTHVLVLSDSNSGAYTGLTKINGAWLAQIDDLPENVRLFNHSGYAKTVDSNNSEFSTAHGPVASATVNICVIWNGFSDMAFGANEATTWSRLQTLCANATSAGFDTIIMGTLPPRDGWSAVTRDNINDLIVGGLGTDYNTLVPIHTDPTAGVDDSFTTYPALWNTFAYYNAAGEAVLKTLFWDDALFPLVGPSGTVTGISITEGNQTLYGGQTFDFTGVVVGDADFDSTIAWTCTAGSINPTTGLFTAPGGKHDDAGGEQSVTITATSNGDASFTATRTVTVPRHAPEGGGGTSGTVGGILGA